MASGGSAEAGALGADAADQSVRPCNGGVGGQPGCLAGWVVMKSEFGY